jgi:hypothetical protein
VLKNRFQEGSSPATSACLGQDGHSQIEDTGNLFVHARIPDNPTSIIKYPESAGSVCLDGLPEPLRAGLNVDGRLARDEPFLGDRSDDLCHRLDILDCRITDNHQTRGCQMDLEWRKRLKALAVRSGSLRSDAKLARREAAVAVEQLTIDPLALFGEQEPNQICGVRCGAEPTGGLHRG